MEKKAEKPATVKEEPRLPELEAKLKSESSPPLSAEAQKAKDEATKVEAEAAEKAGKINANLIKDGSPRRVQGGVRNGEPSFVWGNFVPTQFLTDEELEAVGAMKKPKAETKDTKAPPY